MSRGPCTIALALAALALAGAAGAVTFEDAQAEAGLSFRRVSDQDPNFPQTNGGGACWGDFDGDGTDDVFLVNSRYKGAALQAEERPRSRLFLNEGDGTFADVTEAAGVGHEGWGDGCSAADYDGDGDLDLLLVLYGYNVLYRNLGQAVFENATAASGLSIEGKCGEDPCFGSTGAWADYDRDGDLDVYVTNYANWNITEGGPVTPDAYDGQRNLLFRNDGDGTFTDVTDEAGVGDDPGPERSKSFQASWHDYDRDGWPDIYIASDTTPNTLFRNSRNGTFTDVAAEAGVDDDRSSMGLVFQDNTGDGWPDLYFTHYAGENNGFYENERNGTFKDRSGEGDLGNDFDLIGWGTGFHDFDHDGDLDVYAVNGHTSPDVPNAKMKPLLFRQNADGKFTDVTDQSGESFSMRNVSRGSAVSDYDLDGDLDIVVNNVYNETARLFQHQGTDEHWLQLELRQPGTLNVLAVGAEARVTPPDGKAMHRLVQAGNSFLSQDSTVLHVGLGNHTSADVEVTWPDGAVERWKGLAADQRVRLTRGSQATINDTLSPRTAIVGEGPGSSPWFRDTFEVRLDPRDRGVTTPSGVAAAFVRLDRAAWQVFGAPLRLSEEGRYLVEGYAVDLVGNVEPVRSAAFVLDRTPPESRGSAGGIPGEEGWVLRVAGVALEASDALSGVEVIRYRVDGGAWGDYEGPFELDTSGVHEVEFFARDRAGNEEAPHLLVVKVDAEAPSVSAVEPWPAGLALGRGEVRVEASDPGSGVGRVEFYLDGAAESAFVDDDGGDGWSWSFAWQELGAGPHEVEARAVDRAGQAAGAGLWMLVLPAPPPLGSALWLPLLLAAWRRGPRA